MHVIISCFPDDGREIGKEYDLPAAEARQLIFEGRAREVFATGGVVAPAVEDEEPAETD